MIGTVPWPANEFTWSADGRFMCAVLPGPRHIGNAPLRLEVASIGQSPRVVASGFGTYTDNAVHRVLACDETTDRAVVAVYGHGVAPARLWVLRLSDGSRIRSLDYAGTGMAWVSASRDGTLIAETEPATAAGVTKATVRRADDGSALGTLAGVWIHGFSADNSFVVAAQQSGRTEIRDWRADRLIWSALGAYGGHRSEPAGQRLAIGIGYLGGGTQRDLYIVDPDGSAVLLPSGALFGGTY
jgi:hypothetical protein